jgi:hypothetical protein
MSPQPVIDPVLADFGREKAQANVLAAAKWQCELRNEDLKTIYLSGFNDWKYRLEQGLSHPPDPPQPPASFVVKDDSGWAYVDQTGPAVCEVPPLPVMEYGVKPVDGAVDIGPSADQGAGVWFAAGPHDGVKPGTIVTTPAGKFQRVGFPFGFGWYQKIG